MLNWIDWIDEKLLALATKATKAYNWTTGNDNVSLARIITKVGFGIVFALFLLHCIISGNITLGKIIAGICVIAMSFFIIIDINNSEKGRTKEQLDGARSIELEMKLKSDCMHDLCFLLFSSASFFFLYPFVEEEFIGDFLLSLMYVVIYFITQLVVHYLLRVEKPPFAKSQLRKLIDSLFAKREPARITSR